MARTTTKVEVMRRVLDRLALKVSGVTHKNCYPVLDPNEPPPAGARDNTILTVAMPGAPFDVAAQDGGSESVLLYDAQTIVTLWSEMRLDQKGRYERMLLDAERGLFAMEGAILAALCGHALDDENDNPILARDVAVVSSSSPGGGEKLADLQITFTIPFQWDLSGYP